MLGYPGNGPYHETPVRVGRVVTIIGRDAYGNFPTSREVTTLRGTIRSGNSGGPVVDAQGDVITTVFARAGGLRRRLRGADRDRAERARAGGHEARSTACLCSAGSSSRSSAASGCLNGGIT